MCGFRREGRISGITQNSKLTGESGTPPLVGVGLAIICRPFTIVFLIATEVNQIRVALLRPRLPSLLAKGHISEFRPMPPPLPPPAAVVCSDTIQVRFSLRDISTTQR